MINDDEKGDAKVNDDALLKRCAFTFDIAKIEVVSHPSPQNTARNLGFTNRRKEISTPRQSKGRQKSQLEMQVHILANAGQGEKCRYPPSALTQESIAYQTCHVKRRDECPQNAKIKSMNTKAHQ
jgi:hypothetical protein